MLLIILEFVIRTSPPPPVAAGLVLSKETAASESVRKLRSWFFLSSVDFNCPDVVLPRDLTGLEKVVLVITGLLLLLGVGDKSKAL